MALEALRRFMAAHLHELTTWVPVVFLLAVTALFLLKRRAGARAAGLLFCLGLAGWAQVYVAQRRFAVGALLYGAAVVVLVVWHVRFARREAGPAWPFALERRTEMALLAIVLAVAFLARFAAINRVPYGIEGDESKWTYETAAEMIAGQHLGSSEYHLKYLPVSFYAEAIFFRLFGLDFLSARYEVAFFSFLAMIFFYLLVREVADVPVALVATFLLSVSIVDVSASRLALVESHIKFWLILSYFSLFYALKTGRRWLFLLTGVALALGMLTYETFYVTPVVVLVWIAYRLLRERDRWRQYAINTALLLLPVAMVLPVSLGYLRTRQGYHATIANSIVVHPPFSPAFWATFWENLTSTLYNFYAQRWGDFLVNRSGPIINAALVPFLVLGLTLAVLNLRRGNLAFPALWFALQFFPAPLIFGAAYVRVMYAAFPAMYVLIALAMGLCLRELLRALGPSAGRYLLGAFVLGLFALGTVNLYIYFNEVHDFEDRERRREMADLMTAYLSPGEMFYIPYLPGYGDWADVEQLFLKFVAWGRAPIGSEDDFYRLLPYDELLPTVSAGGDRFQAIHVMYDIRPRAPAEEREQAISGLQTCYPDYRRSKGRYYEVYTVERDELQAPRCYSNVTVEPRSPTGGQTVVEGQPLVFDWELAGGQQRSFQLQCQQQNERVIMLQAEDFSKTGWYEETAFAPGFLGRGYLADWWQAGEARLRVDIPAPGRYSVWVRSWRRVADDTHAYLRVGSSQSYEFARGALGQWIWESLGPVELNAGIEELGLVKHYGQSPHMAIFVDAIVLSRDPNFDPEVDTIWEPVFDSGEVVSSLTAYTLLPPGAGAAATPGDVPPSFRRWTVRIVGGDRVVDGLLLVEDGDFAPAVADNWQVVFVPPSSSARQRLGPGAYRWRVRVMDGERLVDWRGLRGVWSDYGYFRIVSGEEQP